MLVCQRGALEPRRPTLFSRTVLKLLQRIEIPHILQGENGTTQSERGASNFDAISAAGNGGTCKLQCRRSAPKLVLSLPSRRQMTHHAVAV